MIRLKEVEQVVEAALSKTWSRTSSIYKLQINQPRVDADNDNWVRSAKTKNRAEGIVDKNNFLYFFNRIVPPDSKLTL